MKIEVKWSPDSLWEGRRWEYDKEVSESLFGGMVLFALLAEFPDAAVEVEKADRDSVQIYSYGHGDADKVRDVIAAVREGGKWRLTKKEWEERNGTGNVVGYDCETRGMEDRAGWGPTGNIQRGPQGD